MPYISQDERNILLKGVETPATAGQLNYTITLAIKDYIKQKGLSYQTINDIYGALTGAQFEFARRVVNGYEDKKIKENGDVY